MAVGATPTQQQHRKWFSAGYQQALADVDQAFKDGGEQAAREWITTNLRKQA